MGYILITLSICLSLSSMGQANDPYLRLTLIKAKEVSNYGENLTQKFVRLHQQRIKDGIING